VALIGLQTFAAIVGARIAIRWSREP
jgi:hypothetical protein